MSITCECPECGKRLKAADSAAGKKAKCPDCEAGVPIPKPKPKVKKAVAADDDEFDLQNLNIDAGVEGPVGEDEIACPMCGEMIRANASKCRYCGEDMSAPRKKKKKGKRTRSEVGIPIPAIVAMVVESVFILINGFALIGQLVVGSLPGGAGLGLKLAINIAVLAGLIQRKRSTRTSALILSGLGLFVVLLTGGAILFASQLPQVEAQAPQEGRSLVVGLLVVQTIMYIVQIAMLLTGTAREYFDQ